MRLRARKAFGSLLLCATLAGCDLRPLTERDVAGTYRASAQWGVSTLVLSPDHSFEQTIMRKDGTQASTKGTWELGMFAGKTSSHGIIVLKNFIAIDHEHKYATAGLALPGINRTYPGGVEIAADPDWGISFNKRW